MKNSICAIGSSLKNVMMAINAEPAGVAFIVAESGELRGVVTDGDMRRLLLLGKNLSDNLMAENLGDFVVGRKGEDFDALMRRTSKRIRVIPIVDDENKPIDYFRYEHKTHFTPVAEPSLTSKELEYLTDAFLSTWISSKGKYIDRFEEEFSTFSDCEYGVATSNGTVAMHLALVALGVGKGDEVIVPDLTFAATINAVLYTGATPVIVDVDEERWTISPTNIKEAITDKTKAIIPVHIYGQPCEMDIIMDIAKENSLYVIEDCAEAHGATFNGKKVGSFGDISTFSFFGNKIITTGEGGMCVTNSKELDEKMRVLRDHGMSTSKRYWHDEVGFNYRMTNLQAAIGCAQLERIDEIIESHSQIELNYKEHLSDVEIVNWQKEFENSKKVVWLVALTISNGKRDEVITKLKENNIDVRPFFYCLSEMPIYREYSKENPVAKKISEMGINLPTLKNVDFNGVAKLIS